MKKDGFRCEGGAYISGYRTGRGEGAISDRSWI